MTETRKKRGGQLSKLLNKNKNNENLLDLDLLQAGKYQPRKTFDDESLKELSSSIKSQGVIQPIIVRAIEDGRFEIVVGERRWRASKLAELKTIPAIVRKLDDKATLAMALVENLQREDLKPMDEAEALQQLKTEFKLKDIEIAEMIGKSKSEVSRLFGLLKLPDCLKALYERGVTSSNVLEELARAYKENKKETEAFVTGKDSITVQEARDFKNRGKIKSEKVEKIPMSGFSETKESESSTEVEKSSTEKEPEIVETQSQDEKVEVETEGAEDKKISSTKVLDIQESDNGADFTESLDQQSTSSVETPFVNPVSNSKVRAISVEYDGKGYHIDLDRVCEDSKFCFIKNDNGDELKVEVLGLIVVSLK